MCAAQFCRPLDKRWIRASLLLRNCERYLAKPFSTPNSRGTILACRGSQQVSKSLLKEMQYEKSFGFPSSSNRQVLSTCATKPPAGARERGGGSESSAGAQAPVTPGEEGAGFLPEAASAHEQESLQVLIQGLGDPNREAPRSCFLFTYDSAQRHK